MRGESGFSGFWQLQMYTLIASVEQKISWVEIDF